MYICVQFLTFIINPLELNNHFKKKLVQNNVNHEKLFELRKKSIFVPCFLNCENEK